MATVQELRRKLDTTRELGSVVSTMKALAAVNIRQFEAAAKAMDQYQETVALGLKALLTLRGRALGRGLSDGPVGLVVLGSDQGLAGPLNEQVAQTAHDQLVSLDGQPLVCCAGERVWGLLMDQGHPVGRFLEMPGSVAGIGQVAQELWFWVERQQRERNLSRLWICHARLEGVAGFRPVVTRVLPLDQAWLEELRAQPWPGRGLPMFTMETQELFSALVRQYLVTSFHQALAQSLASENASRLAAMQSAEKNIEQRRQELSTRYHQARQEAITGELLDIVAGFEAQGGGEPGQG